MKRHIGSFIFYSVFLFSGLLAGTIWLTIPFSDAIKISIIVAPILSAFTIWLAKDYNDFPLW